MIYLSVKQIRRFGNHGHQLKDLLGILTICKIFGFTYVSRDYEYLGFFGIDYRELNINDLDPTIEKVTVLGNKSWEGMSFDALQQAFTDIASNHKDKDCLIEVDLRGRKTMRVHPCQTVKWFSEGLLTSNICEEIIEEVSHKFRIVNGTKSSTFNENTISVCVHIGRGLDYDSPAIRRAPPSQPRHFFPISYFEHIIAQISSILEDKKYSIRVYTEALNSEEIVNAFSERENENIELKIGSNRTENNFSQVHDIFYDFVDCDILVICNSSFSVTASYFRQQGITIYHPHQHLYDLPNDKFLPTNIDGSFDASKIYSLMQ